jgi:hypothetical protein
MGQQQLLLIIVGVIIVGAAIAVGIHQFTIGAESANREAIVNDIASIVGNAQGYMSRPSLMGGGNGSFSGYTLPFRLSETGNATYTADGNDNILIVEGASLIHRQVVVTLILTKLDNNWDYEWLWEHEGL